MRLTFFIIGYLSFAAACSGTFLDFRAENVLGLMMFGLVNIAVVTAFPADK